MPLSTAERNAHLVALIAPVLGQLDDEDLAKLLRRSMRYGKLGADHEEAAQFLRRRIIREIRGRTPNADDLHFLTTHLIPKAERGTE